MKYAKDFRQHFSKLPVFSSRDARLFLVGKGSSKQYARLFLFNLAKRGEVKRVIPGAYTFKEDLEVVGMAFQPYYYGLQDALSTHGVWEQETNPIVITPRKVRPGMRAFLGNNYWVRRISRKMFFGFESVEKGGLWVNVSDLEKTLVDFAYFKSPLSEEALEQIKPKLDEKKLRKYLAKSPLRVSKRVAKLLSSV